MSKGKKNARREGLLSNVAWKMALAIGLTSAGMATNAEAVVTPDTVSPADVVDTENDRPYLVGVMIRNEAGNGGGTCSGLLINPRTVLFAAHCVDGLNPDAYDGNSVGNRAQVGYTSDPTFGRTNLREWLFGQDFAVPAGDARVADASSVMVWYDPRSRFGPLTDPNGGTFLPADIALAAFDTPTDMLGRDAENGVGLLFSPVDRLVQVTIGGYGRAGDGMTSLRLAGTEDTFFRRVATNMLGYLGSERDISNGAEPQDVSDIFNPPTLNYQDLYWVDFDDPLNRPFDTSINANYGGPTDAGGPVNPGATTTLDFNIFNDEATANEAITAAGDSGSPLITDAYGRDVSLGVLSQGSRSFFDITGFEDDNFVHFTDFSNFGTTAGYNPLFLFWDQIVVNNPYKYVQARAGNREWTDPTTWVQEIDPLYFTLSAHGNLRNRLPNQPALGSSDDADNLGSINPNPSPIAACAFTVCPTTGGGSAPMPDTTALPSPEEAAHGGPPSPPPPPGPSTADWLTGGLIPYGSGALTGPGTTGFVPDNTNGTAGLQNSTRFFEVNLRNHGTLSLTGADIEIDRLNIRGVGAELNIRAGASLTTNLSSYMDVGRLNVDGAFNPLSFDIGFGILSGTGTITAAGGVANNAGVISPAGWDIGTLNIVGDYAQGGYGTVLFQIGRHGADLLNVDGHVDMAGNLLVDSSRRLRFGNRFTVVQADSVSGNFDRTFGSGTLLFGETVADADSIDLVISAHRLWSLYGNSHRWGSLALALDRARFDGSYDAMQGVFDLIDNVQLDSLDFVLPTLTPVNSFSEMPLAISYAQGFTRDLFARTAELRAGQRGISQRSLMSGYRALNGQAVEDPTTGETAYMPETGRPIDTGERLGFFFSGQGNLNDVGAEAYAGDRFDPASLSQASTANMTVGADYRVNDHFALGVASTISRYLANSGEITPLEHMGYGAMLYASAWDGGWFADAYVGVAQQDYAMSRSLLTGIPLQTVDAEEGATQSLAGMRAGYAFSPAAGFTVTPMLTVNYSHLDFDSYRESGGGDFDLIVDSRQLMSLTVESAVEFTYQPIRNGRASPFAAYGRIGLVNEVGDGSDVLSARFAAAPDIAFNLSQEMDRQWYSAGGGLSYQFDADTSFNLEARTDLDRDDFSSTSVNLGFNRRF